MLYRVLFRSLKFALCNAHRLATVSALQSQPMLSSGTVFGPACISDSKIAVYLLCVIRTQQLSRFAECVNQPFKRGEIN
jgi:hypothetical protein